MIKDVYINLTATDLDKTKAFWERMGFSFNPKFSNEKALCLLMGEHIYVMFLKPEFFQTFTEKSLIDATSQIQVLNAVFVESREEVDELLKKGVQAGGKEVGKTQDYGWMYSRNLEDVDGHVWEIGFGDETLIPADGLA